MDRLHPNWKVDGQLKKNGKGVQTNYDEFGIKNRSQHSLTIYDSPSKAAPLLVAAYKERDFSKKTYNNLPLGAIVLTRYYEAYLVLKGKPIASYGYQQVVNYDVATKKATEVRIMDSSIYDKVSFTPEQKREYDANK